MSLRTIVVAILCGMTILLPDIAPAQNAAPPAPSTANLQIQRYHAALAVDPDNLPLHYFLGVTLLLEGQDQEAIVEFRRAYPAFTDSIEANYNLGLALTRTGDYDSALLYLDRAEELGALDSPDLYPLADAYFNLALGAFDNQALDEAAGLFQRVLELAPNRLEVHRLLGDLYAKQGRNDLALNHFTTYLEHDPNDLPTRAYLFALHMNQGTSLLENGDHAAARKAFEKARPLDQTSPLPDYYLGYLDYSQGQLVASVEKLNQAYPKARSEVRQSIQAMLYNTALTMLQQRKTRLALETLSMLLGESAAEAKVLALAGKIHLTLKEYQAAYSLLNRAVQLDPALGSAAANLIAAEQGAYRQLLDQGQNLLEQKDPLEARHRFEQALDLRPDELRARTGLEEAEAMLSAQAETWFTQSRQALQAEHPGEALELVRNGLELVPDSPGGGELEQQALARLRNDLTLALAEGLKLLETGKLSAAEAALNRALALAPNTSEALKGLKDIENRRFQLAEEATSQAHRAQARHRYRDARSLLQQALTHAPNHQGASAALTALEAQLDATVADLLQKGRKARDAGRFSEGRGHFNQALKLEDSPRVRQELKALEQVLQTRLDRLLNAARKAAAQEDFRQAEALYAKVLRLDPQNPWALQEKQDIREQAGRSIRQQLANAEKLLEAGNLKESLAAYRKILDAAPDNPDALAGLQRGHQRMDRQLSELLGQGKKALASGDIEGARALWQKLLAMDPYHRKALEEMERLSELKKSGLQPGDKQRLYLKGIEFYTQGRYEEAISLWDRVLILQPDHDKARMNIDKARRKLKQIKEFGNG